MTREELLAKVSDIISDYYDEDDAGRWRKCAEQVMSILPDSAQPSVSPVTAEASTALRPYGTPASPITPGITWEDHLAAEADDAQTH